MTSLTGYFNRAYVRRRPVRVDGSTLRRFQGTHWDNIWFHSVWLLLLLSLSLLLLLPLSFLLLLLRWKAWKLNSTSTTVLLKLSVFVISVCDRDQMNLYPLGKSKGTLTLTKFYHLNFAHIVLFKRQLRQNVFLLPDVEHCSNENVPRFWYLFY